MTVSANLPPGAWVFRIDTSYSVRAPEVDSAHAATDHVTATVGPTTVLFGGLLHNRAELIQLLGEDSDQNEASLLGRAYERWGEAAIERAKGSCAIVICDWAERIVLAARDPLGTYPLFHAEAGDALLLSNSIDALLTQNGVSNALHLHAIIDHLRHAWPFADETYFEAVRRVPPGNVLRRDEVGTRLRRYWDPARDGRVDWVQPDDVEQFDALFEQAIARCQTRGRVGIFLSGGLDSVSVAAVATSRARATGEPDPLALSLAFPGPEANEEPVQRAVAASLGLEQVILDWEKAIGPRGLLRESIDLSSRAPAPLLNLWMPAYDRLAASGRERGCVTIITGSGGDEWLIVSPYYAADLIRKLDFAGVVRLFNDHRRSHNVSALPYLRNILWRFGLRPLALHRTVVLLQRHAPSGLRRAMLWRLDQKTPTWLAPAPELRRELAARELRRRDEQWETLSAPEGAGRRYPRVYFAEARSGFEHPLVSMELEEVYAHGRRRGLHMLMPFWDVELVEFLYRTPPELLNAGGRSKALVRSSVARRFPGLGFEHQRKIAATDVVRSLVEGEGRRAWSELRGVGALEDAHVVDATALRARVEEILRTRERRYYHLVWDLLALESFLRARRQG